MVYLFHYKEALNNINNLTTHLNAPFARKKEREKRSTVRLILRETCILRERIYTTRARERERERETFCRFVLPIIEETGERVRERRFVFCRALYRARKHRREKEEEGDCEI